MATDFINELKTHALFHQATDEEGLRKHLTSGQRRGYAGFDPTADSFTIGNMVPMILLRHLQLAGHTPVILSGGGRA
jgi:tyrosyl-tRNA synthetase